MSHATYLIGDVFDRMAELPDNSIDLVLTSPPFLALRSYLPEDHPNKHKEIGSEPNPAEFVDVLLALSAEWRRVLAPHGSIAIELGDTFSGSNTSQQTPSDRPQDGGYQYKDPDRVKRPGFGHNSVTGIRNMDNKIQGGGPGWPLPKSLALVPEAYRFALAYGHNPHTGTESPAGQWRIRNVIRWVRPNPPVGALGDKFRPATSEMVVATVASDRFFDLDAVRSDVSEWEKKYWNGYGNPGEGKSGTNKDRGDGGWSCNQGYKNPPAGAPPLDWWKISPKGYAGAHYAVWPAELCIKPIKAMCPEKVCRTCGEPSRRVVGEVEYTPSASYRGGHTDLTESARVAPGVNQFVSGGGRASVVRSAKTEGFTDCGHDNWRPGIVLDPFAGTGTTLAVATGHGRDAIGIDIDERNAELAEERIGPMFLTIEGAT